MGFGSVDAGNPAISHGPGGPWRPRLLEVTENLAASPERGSKPKELQTPGIREYRQVFFKPYRVIYRVMDKRVVIYLTADGRRDMQTLLVRRLLDER